MSCADRIAIYSGVVAQKEESLEGSASPLSSNADQTKKFLSASKSTNAGLV